MEFRLSSPSAGGPGTGTATCVFTGIPIDEETGRTVAFDSAEFGVCFSAAPLLAKLVSYAQFGRYATAREDSTPDEILDAFLFCEAQIQKM